MTWNVGAFDVRRLRRHAGVSVLVVGLLTAACSSGDPAAKVSDASAAATSTTAAPAAIEQFSGAVDDFYRVPDPLPAGRPGELIRTMPIDAPAGETGMRIMYHSTDAEGDDRAVTGVVYTPTGKAPDGGWPIVAWAHGTSGLAAKCAPSRHPAPPPDYGIRGVQVSTDYIGLGPVGELHPYLSAAAEGNGVIDSVAAVRALPDLHAGNRWVVVGVSQGGHAALVTNEMAAQRLPGVELLGAVALAPGSQLAETYGDDLQARAIITMVLVGITADDPSVQLSDYLSPDAVTAAAVIEDGCVAEILAALPAVAASPNYFVTDPRTSPVGVAWLAKNDPGRVAATSPLLLVQGEQDILVLPARTDALFARLCKLGQVVQRLDVATADHGTVVDLSRADVTTWLAARFAGTPVTNAC